MELMTEEIEGFNRSIYKLEGLSRNLRNLKIKTDTKKIEHLLATYLEDERRSLVYYKGIIKKIEGKLNRAKTTPRWLLALCSIVLSLSFLTIGYFGYHFVQFEEMKKAAYMDGKLECISQMRGYFENHPIIYKDFQKWARRQDSMPCNK